jgi:ElaB/YqjD/DUF883 family membrane-anchored ribosome-binding protein
MSSTTPLPGQGDDPQLTPDAAGPEPGADASQEEIEADIARTRRELGETVEALSGKLDPKAQAQHQVERLRAQAEHQVEHLRARARVQVDHAREQVDHARHAAADSDNPVPALVAAAAGAALFAAVGLLITRRS